MKTGTVKILAYLLFAATFASLLSISMDRHFEEMATQRINFQGWGGHTLARVVSPVLVGLVHSSGIPVRTSALIYIGVSTFLLLNAYAWYLGKSAGLDGRLCLLAAPLILLPMVWNYILLSSAHYIDDVPAILFFVLGLGLLSNRDCAPPPLFNLLFIIAVLNRETALFLIPAMFLLEVGKRKLVPLLLHCAVLAISGYLIRLGLIHFLSTSPVTSTSMFEHHFQSNLNFVLSTFRGNPEALRMLMTFGGLWLALPFCRYRENTEHLKLIFLLPLFYIVMLIVGNMSDEARIFSEMVPLVTTVIISICKPGSATQLIR